MRGSPIRKSSDQRSVDSSPRLIAASYVLHRLLVPRHPPCALNNLATQKSHPSTPGRTSMSGPTQTLLIESEDARVHCAVLNVQPDTDPTPPPDPQPPTGDTAVRQKIDPAEKKRNARSLRTQQRAYEPTHHTHPVPHATRRRRRTRSSHSCRPNWSAFHPRAPPHTLRGPSVVRGRPGAGAALDHQTSLAASAP